MATVLYKVQVGAFGSKANAQKRLEDIKSKGFNAILVYENKLYKVQCGAFANKANATNLKTKLEKVGFKVAIIQTNSTTKSSAVSGAQKVYNEMKPYIDSSSAHSKVVKEFNKMMDKLGHSHISNDDAWCTEFVDLMFYLSGQLDLIGYAKDANTLYKTAKNNGTWKSGTSDIKFGDVVIYKNGSGNPNHTEFAIGSHDFVSGNYKGGVHKRHRSSLNTVKGRIRPKYKE